MKGCTATLDFADDYGDNPCTMRCQLPEGHDGPHQEAGNLHMVAYTVTWNPLPGDVPVTLETWFRPEVIEEVRSG